MTDYSAYIRQTAKIVGVSDDHEAVAACEKVVQQELVYRLAYNSDGVAFKMGRRQGARRAHISIDT
jgi:hypothetical protein